MIDVFLGNFKQLDKKGARLSLTVDILACFILSMKLQTRRWSSFSSLTKMLVPKKNFKSKGMFKCPSQTRKV